MIHSCHDVILYSVFQSESGDTQLHSCICSSMVFYYLRQHYLGQRHCLGHSKQVPFSALKNVQLDLSCSTCIQNIVGHNYNSICNKSIILLKQKMSCPKQSHLSTCVRSCVTSSGEVLSRGQCVITFWPQWLACSPSNQEVQHWTAFFLNFKKV